MSISNWWLIQSFDTRISHCQINAEDQFSDILPEIFSWQWILYFMSYRKRPTQTPAEKRNTAKDDSHQTGIITTREKNGINQFKNILVPPHRSWHWWMILNKCLISALTRFSLTRTGSEHETDRMSQCTDETSVKVTQFVTKTHPGREEARVKRCEMRCRPASGI